MQYTQSNFEQALAEIFPLSTEKQTISLKNLSLVNRELAYYIINNIKQIDLSKYKINDNLTQIEISEISTSMLNKLITIVGRVTRSSGIIPEMVKAEMICGACNSMVVAEQSFGSFKCPNHLCTNRFRFKVNPLKFRDQQVLNVQESEIKSSYPKSLKILCYDDLTEAVCPGQIVTFNGYIEIKNIEKKIKKTLSIETDTHNLVFRCISIDEIRTNEFNLDSVLNKIGMVKDLYPTLAQHLFPSIYGHGNIKKAILLQLIAGSSTKRKNINILLLGDPGTAKSQFLKQISDITINHNIIYTTGKTSSGVGLTAAVVKSLDNESLIEAGALVLSDNGICCIDEFDKLSHEDKTALHESMEQQTITINKSGINITLNARSSVLAAANPKNGRYDKKQSLKNNVNLTDTIMSRFDLFYIIVDEVNEQNDRRVAKRVINNHLNVLEDEETAQKDELEKFADKENISESNKETNNEESKKQESVKSEQSNIILTKQEILIYLNHVKNYQPKMLKESKELIISKYKKLRLQNTISNNNFKISIRTLESLIRISESIAKLYKSDVLPEYVEEGYRLITNSLVEIKFKDIQISNKTVKREKIEKILNNFVFVLKTNERLSKEDLIYFYIDSIVNTLNDEFELVDERRNAEDVLDYLIAKEGVLYENGGFIYVHPDYDV